MCHTDILSTFIYVLLSPVQPFVFLVVAQQYESEPENEYVIRGNNLILKCKIPSFVADFLQIIAWVDSDGQEYTPQTSSHGKEEFQLSSI